MRSEPVTEALVIGGIWRFVEQNLSVFLMEYGIEIDAARHHGIDRPFEGPIRGDVKIVIVIQGMVAEFGKSTDRAKRLAKERGIPCVIGSHHKSHLRPILESYGFKRILSPENAQAIGTKDIEMIKPPPPQADLDKMNFDQLQAHLILVVRSMRDRHGVRAITWGAGGSLEVERPVVHSLSLDA